MPHNQEEPASESSNSVPVPLWQLKQRLKDFETSLFRQRQRMKELSFHKQLNSYINLIHVVERSDRFENHPLRDIPRKLRMYEFAASHGVSIPRVYNVWADPKAIDLSILPDQFVIKSDGGSSSRGVIPLRRLSSSQYVRIDDATVCRPDDLIEYFLEESNIDDDRGCIFAEELIVQNEQLALPDDIKIYSSYGKCMMVMLRRVSYFSKTPIINRRYLGPDGSDLIPPVDSHSPDKSISVPCSIQECINIANHLSGAMGIPFCRVDLYSSLNGVVFGEVTRAPGEQTYFSLDLDNRLGELWLEGEARLQLDLQRGRPPGVLWGTRRFLDLYPPSDKYSRLKRVMSFQSCEDWCNLI